MIKVYNPPFNLFVTSGSDKPLTIELRKLIDTIVAAAHDPKITSLHATFGDNLHLGPAQIEELRDAIILFNQVNPGQSSPNANNNPDHQTIKLDKPKSSSCYTHSFGNQKVYWTASAFERVKMLQHSGVVMLTGISSTHIFAKDLLDRHKVGAEGIFREKYKKAYSIFTDRTFTPEHLDNISSILASIHDSIFSSIAKSRSLPSPTESSFGRKFWYNVLNSGPIFDDEAEQTGLVDGTALGGEDETVKECERLTLERYSRILRNREKGHFFNQVKRQYQKLKENSFTDLDFSKLTKIISDDKEKIAIVHINGQITTGYGEMNSTGDLDITKALRELKDDDAVKCVILRIDSPGGSPIASEAVYNEIISLDQIKPVICSMGNLAASGGYYVAAPCRKIYASPTTITGSIGVLFGKLDLSNFLETYGLNVEHVETGQYANILSMLTSFSSHQREILEHYIDHTYNRFLAIVSKGRSLPEADTRKLAGGRIWTGEQAYNLGLVDSLGGLRCAVEFAQTEYTEKGDALVEVWSNKKSGFEALLKGVGLVTEGNYTENYISNATSLLNISSSNPVDSIKYLYNDISSICTVHDDWAEQWLNLWID
eukprot:CAMPEP_0113315702 /NCGR_PEP_ID=MMETSP0010_2-20120614/11267_1 /TAXON_ID=216773 ORGANISM="Corethron hystrix, Strain 308" /NCGR_SAMPLE_ID=MMETSP0010_2 /ASSEMBLY_ACC=CAM_ASM_000155 /LENGTH=599 /DNA_ID=CAMNT_0000172261 /DNA_START=1362 /DNA_END=3160 /DNA_ORIENTATION=- /assembly_acc=CAM_ASM_000155